MENAALNAITEKMILTRQNRVCVHAVFLRHDCHRHRDDHNLILRSSII